MKMKNIIYIIIFGIISNSCGFNDEYNFRLAKYNYNKTGDINSLKTYIETYPKGKFADQAYLSLINYYKNNNDHKNSVITSGKALRNFPNHPDLLNKHAWNIYLFKVKEDYPDAIEMVQSAIKINPNIAEYWDTQAWLLHETGDSKNAVVCEKRAIELFPHEDYKNALHQFISEHRKNI